MVDKTDVIVSILRGIEQEVDNIATIDDSTISSKKTYSSSKISTLLANAGFKVSVVVQLPTKGNNNIIYFVPAKDTTQGNVYDEYLYVDNKWELIGSTKIDLSDYVTNDQFTSSFDILKDDIYIIKDEELPTIRDILNDAYTISWDLQENYYDHVHPFICEELPILYSRIQTLEEEIEYLKQNNNTVNTSWFSINLPNNQVWLSGYYSDFGCTELPQYDFGTVHIIQAEEYKTPSVFTFDGNVTSVEDVLSDDGIPKVWIPGSVKNVSISPNNGVGLVKNLVYFEEGVEYVGTRYPILSVNNLYLPSSLKEIVFDTGGFINNIFYNGTKEQLTNIWNALPVINSMLYCNDYFYYSMSYEDPIWKPEEIPANEIWYKTRSGNPITLDIADLGLYETEALGANILSHEPEGDKYIITCDSPVDVNINVFSESQDDIIWLGVPSMNKDEAGVSDQSFYFTSLRVFVVKNTTPLLMEWFKISKLYDYNSPLIDINSEYFSISDNSVLTSASLILRSEKVVQYANSYVNSNYNVFVPKALVNQYKNDTNWCVHNIYSIPDQYYIN